MKRLLLVLIIFSLQIPVVFTVNGEEKKTEGAVLESISYEKDNDDFEKIIFKLNGTHIPKIFKIKGEKPRLVFDFIDTRYSDLINNIINTEGGLIKGVRVGIHNDPPKTRVVVDIKPEGKFQFEQDFLIQENVLSITFHPDDVNQPETPVSSTGKKPTEPAVKTVATQKDPMGKKAAVKQSKPPKDTKKQAATVRPTAEKGGEGVEKATVTTKDSPGGATTVEKSTVESKAVDEVNPILAQITQEKPIQIDPILEDVSFESTANDSEMVLFKLNDFYPPIVFGIEKGNPRVVCDFLDTDLAEDVRSVIQTKGMYVSRVRTALHANPHKVRVVLDLVPNRNYDLQQVFFKEDNLFVIIINEFEEESVQSPSVPETQTKSKL